MWATVGGETFPPRLNAPDEALRASGTHASMSTVAAFMEAGMSSYEGTDATDAGIDLWRVQLATGEMRAMSLDALDDAFQSGLIDESTPVLPPGATGWTRLADAAGLEAAPVESNVPSVAPLAVSISESTGAATPYAQSAHAAALAGIDLAAIPDNAFKPEKGRIFAGIGLAVLVAGALGFAATRVGGIGANATSSLTSSQARAAAAAAAPPPAAIDLEESTRRAAQLTEEQKQRLAEFDKAREAREAREAAAKQKSRPAAQAPRGPREKGTAPFVNGGSKYDPLNGAL